MTIRWKLACGLLCGIGTFALAGCAAVDLYSERAVTYNLQAEEALDQGLLLNIVRAVYRRPMQFTSVQTISGVASASGTAAFPSIPVGPHSAPMPKIASLSGTVSGGPTFSVPVLDTQEFYQGVMAPITSQLFDFYIHEEFPREEILSLFVEKIVITKQTDDCIPPTGKKSHTLECELIFVNNPNSDLDFDLFQSFVEHLINLGMITEPVNSPRAATQKASGGCASNTANGATGAATQSSTNSSNSSQQCQPPAVEFRFCFSPKYPELRAEIDQQAICVGSGADPNAKPNRSVTITKESTKTEHGVTTKTTEVTVESGSNATGKSGPGAAAGTPSKQAGETPDEKVTGQIGKKTVVGAIRLSPAFIHNLLEVTETSNREFPPSPSTLHNSSEEYRMYSSSLRHFSGQSILFTIYTRSTEGILYFLGEIVRHQMTSAHHRLFQIKFEKSLTVPKFSERPCNPEEVDERYADWFDCNNFFVLNTGAPIAAGPLGVNYDGQSYTVPADDSGGDTVHVLSIVKQLLAVNTSAKSLPQTNVLSVISQ
jgi:hypothetical protein